MNLQTMKCGLLLGLNGMMDSETIKQKIQEKAQKKAYLNDSFMRDEIDIMQYSSQMSALDLDETTLNQLLNQ